MAALTVACVKWGRKYPAEYVVKLRNMCRRNLPAHDFVCVTEEPVEGVECRPLLCELPHWWQKIGLFRPGAFAGDVLYLDLDVVITGPLGGLVALLDEDRSRLWALDDFGYPLTNPRRGIGPDMRRTLGGDGTVNSSVMLWHGDVARAVWDRFVPEKMDEVHGDQNWITQALWPAINLIPKHWASSYKYGGAGVIRVFHGEPKPHQVSERWVTECWS